MTIYGRAGDVVTMKRRAVVADVGRLEQRLPDDHDLEMLKKGSYVVVLRDDGAEQLYHLTYLRADGGIGEINEALAAVESTDLATLRERLDVFAVVVEAADKALKARGRGGQHVSFHGDFAGATPSIIVQLRRWVRFLKGED